MKTFPFLNIFFVLLSGTSCFVSAKLYYSSLEKDALIAENKEQMEKLIQLNENLENLRLEQAVTKAVPLITDDKFTWSSFFSFPFFFTYYFSLVGYDGYCCCYPYWWWSSFI